MSDIPRSEIKDEYKWDLSVVYKDRDAYEKDIKLVEENINKIKDRENVSLNNPKDLFITTNLILETGRVLQKLFSYSSMKQDEDISNTESIKDLDLLNTLDIKLESVSSFYDVNLLKLKYKDVLDMISKEPKLEEYRNYFKSLFRYKKYILNKEKEKMLVDLSKAYSSNEDIFSSLSDSDIDYGRVGETTLTPESYSVLIKSNDREIRKEAFVKFHNVYGRYKNTFTYLLIGHVKKNIALAKIRGYKSFLYSEMYHDELDTKVLDTLIKSVNDNMEPLYKYYRIKKEILGVEELHLYDTHASVVPSIDNKYTFDEAKEIVKDVLKVFGKDYLDILDKAFTEKWIDIYPNKSKRSGAYSGGCYDTYPYVLTNFQGLYNDVSTLIHELGHSIHSYYSRTNNSFIDSNYKIVVAEVASTVNELLLAYYMLNKSNSPKEKLYILDQLLDLYKSTIYRQTMFEEFEKFVYDNVEQDIPLNSDILDDYYLELNKKYFGKDMVVDKEIKYEWERIPHFYYDFYVYKYATGLSSRSFIVDSILKNKKDAVTNYKEFLKKGRSLPPNEELKITGVDLTKENTYNTAIKMFSDLVDLYEKTYEEYKRSGE